jgi:polygalacturonase
MKNIYLNNLAGNAPNAKSSGLPAAHNTDGFDVSGSTNVTIHDNTVLNQDDCVAITSGDSIEVYNMFCDGSHGLSIGSVGGKSNNNVTNIYFHDSILNNVQNGCRIKTNAGTTGFISGVTYENIAVNNASIYGIDIQQDYLNGGPTGIPTNGVIIQDILIKNILGDVCCGAKDVYVLCGAGSCSNITLDDILIVGGSSECDVKTEGNYRCPLVPVPTNSTA